MRIGMIVTFYGLYFLIITMLVIAVSAMSASAKNALMVLVLVWILFFIVVPKSAQTLGTSLYNAPDKIAFEHAIEDEVSKEGDSHNPDDPHFSQLKSATLKKYGVDSISALPVNYGALVMQEGENITSRIFNKHYDALIGTYKAQNSISSILSFADPYLAIRNISMNLSGTDFDTFTAFQKQTEKYRFEKTKNLNGIHLTQITYKNDSKQKVSAKNWQQQAEFSFQPVSIPGIANVIVNNSVPVPEAAETAIKQREGYHEKWDMPKKPTMEKFYAVYPQYRKQAIFLPMSWKSCI